MKSCIKFLVVSAITAALLTACSNSAVPVDKPVPTSLSSASNKPEPQTSQLPPTSTPSTPDSHFEPEPPVELKKSELPKGWKQSKTFSVNNVGGFNEVNVKLGDFIDSNDEITAFLDAESTYYNIPSIHCNKPDDINMWAQDLNNDGLNELILSAPAGAAYVQTMVIGFDKVAKKWLKLLDSNLLEAVDLDDDGVVEVIETSCGSLPPYVIIHRWNKGQFEKMDVTKATGNDYSMLRQEYFPPLIISGRPFESYYYRYISGQLKEVKSKFLEASEYLILDSNKRKLTLDDIFDLSVYQIDLAKNEIYARHGYVFKNPEYENYFNTKRWYSQNPAFIEDNLGSIEKQNAVFLSEYAKNIKANFREVESGMAIDLNGDNKTDSIKFECEPGGSKFTLNINGSKVTGNGDNLDGSIFVCNIDKDDKYKELAITESGPSDDLATQFFYYNGKEIIPMGRVQGSGYSIKIDGSGIFTTSTRGEILQTWFYTDKYRLSKEHKLENIPQEMYTMNTVVTVRKPISLNKDKNDSSETLDLAPLDIVLIRASDNKEWCLVEDSSGNKGWLQIEGFYNIKGTDLTASDVFGGLCFAD